MKFNGERLSGVYPLGHRRPRAHSYRSSHET